MEKLLLIFVALFCLTSCNKEKITSDVKLVANDEFSKDAHLMIEGDLIEKFSHVDAVSSINPCAEISEHFPIITLDASPTSLGKSFYEFVIISKDYKFQHKGTIVIEDGICHKWEIENKYFKPVIDERYDIQGMLRLSEEEVLLRVSDDDVEKNAVLKVILNNYELASNFIASKETFEQNIQMEEGVNFIAIESIVEGEPSSSSIIPSIEIIQGDQVHNFEIQSSNDHPGAILIVRHN